MELCSLFAFRELGVILGCKRASELCSCCAHHYGDIPCLPSLLTAWQHWHKAQGPVLGTWLSAHSEQSPGFG